MFTSWSIVDVLTRISRRWKENIGNINALTENVYFS